MYPRTSSPTAAILLTVVLVFCAMTPVIAADGSSLRSTRNKVHSFIHRKALEGVGESTTEIFTITATQLPQTSLHDECDPAAVFQRRLAVFYGIPPNRVNIVATDTCRLNFTFVNNSFDGGDYYSNRQLTALLLSLNITYAEQFLFVASLFVSNETSSPSIAPTISPVPRSPPSAQESQSAKKLFLASFTSGSGAASFQQTLAEFLNVDSNRIAWTLESDSARSREHKLTQNILYFSANDNDLLDVADHAEASAASGDSGGYPLPPLLPLRNDIEAAIMFGSILSPEYANRIALQSLSFSIQGGGNDIYPVPQQPSLPFTPVVTIAGADTLDKPFTFAAQLVQTFAPLGSVSNTTLFPLSSVSSSSSNVVFGGAGVAWVEIATCLAGHISAPVVPAPGDGNRPLYTIVGIVFVFTGLAAVIIAVMRRKTYHTLNLEGEYLNAAEGRSAAEANTIEMNPEPLAEPSPVVVTTFSGSSKSTSASDRTNLLSSAM